MSKTKIVGDRLKGKHILVTGAAQGIGHAAAIAFESQGAEVIATDVDSDKLRQNIGADYLHIQTKYLDVTSVKDIEELNKNLDTVDVLFNNVGYTHHGTILECEESDWDRSFNINVKSQYLLCKTLLPRMLEQGHGNIINMASVVSSVKAVPNRFVYGATKAAVIGLTKSIACDYIKQGIRCNCVCPALVETPPLHERMDEEPEYGKFLVDYMAAQPMGRLGKLEEITNLLLYLASDESSFTTGTPFIIDGGYSL